MALGHAYRRINERLRDAGLDQEIIDRIYRVAEALAAECQTGSEAIRLLALKVQVNDVRGERSNGDELWAIVRAKRLHTVMLRRSTQPKTPKALRVQKVTLLPT